MELTREVLQKINAEAEYKARPETCGPDSPWKRAYLALADAARVLDLMIAEQELVHFASREYEKKL